MRQKEAIAYLKLAWVSGMTPTEGQEYMHYMHGQVIVKDAVTKVFAAWDEASRTQLTTWYAEFEGICRASNI